DDHRRTLQLSPARPRTFFQFFPCFLRVVGQRTDLSLPPEVAENSANHRHPDYYRCPVAHKIRSLTNSPAPPAELAEREGFEPPSGVNPKRFSRPPRKTTL